MTIRTLLDESAATVLAMKLSEAAQASVCPDPELAKLFVARAKQLIQAFDLEEDKIK